MRYDLTGYMSDSMSDSDYNPNTIPSHDFILEWFRKGKRVPNTGYESFNVEILAQFKTLTKLDGIRVIGTDTDPYPDYEAMFKDIRQYKQLRVWTGGSLSENHPLSWFPPRHRDGQLSYNTMFRAVHDYYGHFLTGSDFSWAGEWNAYQAHKLMFPEECWPILCAETLGQAAFTFCTGAFMDPQVPWEMEPF